MESVRIPSAVADITALMAKDREHFEAYIKRDSNGVVFMATEGHIALAYTTEIGAGEAWERVLWARELSFVKDSIKGCKLLLLPENGKKRERRNTRNIEAICASCKTDVVFTCDPQGGAIVTMRNVTFHPYCLDMLAALRKFQKIDVLEFRGTLGTSIQDPVLCTISNSGEELKVAVMV